MNRHTFFDLIPPMPQAERQRIQWAYGLAKKYHQDQTRDSGERYFEHVRGVALILIQYGYVQPEYLILAILHDILEDTTIPVSMLEQLFGPTIAREVLTVSKTYGIEDPLTGFVTRSPKRPKNEYFAAIRRNGMRPAIAKAADRLHNLSDLVTVPDGSRWTPQKRLDQVQETREWIIPMVESHEPRFVALLSQRCEIIEVQARHELESAE